jgi:hypothetical protein
MSDADGRAEATKPSSKVGIGETFTFGFAMLRRVLQALGLLWAVGITDTLSSEKQVVG